MTDFPVFMNFLKDQWKNIFFIRLIKNNEFAYGDTHEVGIGIKKICHII